MTSQTSTSSKIAIGLAPLLVAAGLLLAESVLASPIVTERVSIDSTGTEVLGPSSDPSVSEEGRFIAFSSEATGLVPNDTKGFKDVFVHDWAEGITTRVSVSSSGEEANAESNSPFISNDGRFVAFYSNADNLVAGDSNGVTDIFIHDRNDGTTERVSVNDSGVQANGASSSPSLSADGRFVVFASEADNLVAGDSNGETDIFLYDRELDEIELVSVALVPSECANGSSNASIISADGNFVAFASNASNLVPNDLLGRQDIFVRDRVQGVTERVSISSSGDEANFSCYGPDINDDGRFVAFRSTATNLVAGDTNYWPDIFLHDRQSDTTERISVDSDGLESNGASYEASVGVDGRFIAFRSSANNLVAGDTNGYTDVFVRDRQGLTVRISVDSEGVEADDSSYYPVISSDGMVIAFYSLATNLIDDPFDTNGVFDAFAHGEKPEATPEPTEEPTAVPTEEPTAVPTEEPTAVPTKEPTAVPTEEPTAVPTEEPTAVPTEEPTAVPTEEPTAVPTEEPTAVPTEKPTAVPTEKPTAVPTEEPTAVPTEKPTAVPTEKPTAVPTEKPTAVPTEKPTAVPTEKPTAVPTEKPTAVPTEEPTAVPTEEPTAVPTEEPTAVPTEEPTAVPTEEPTAVPTDEPTAVPTEEPGPGVCPIFLDFETSANGDALQAGTFIDDEWAAYGITITTDNPTAHPAMIFDTSNPTGNDKDLGSPNEDFGGPGVGRGGEEGMPGENSLSLDNVLILSQDANPNNPNDYYGGGSFFFEFDQPTDVYEIHILDIDSNERDGVVIGYDADGEVVGREWIAALGDNSFQVLQLGFENVTRLKVKLEASGAIAGLELCPKQNPVDQSSPPEPEPTAIPTMKPTDEPTPTPTPNSKPEATATPLPPKPTNTPDDEPGNYDPSKPGLSIYSCLDDGNRFHLRITNIGAAGKYRLLSSNGNILGPWYMKTGEVVSQFSDGTPITTTIEDTWSIQYRDRSKWKDTSLTYVSSVEEFIMKEDFCDRVDPDPGPYPSIPIVIISASEKTLKEGETFSGAGTIVVNSSQTWTATVDYGDGSAPGTVSVASNEQFELEHIYGDNGEFVLTVTADNENGDQVSKNIVVTINNASPELDFNGLTSFKSCQSIDHFFNFQFKWRVCSDVVIAYARVGEEKVFTTTAVDAGSDDLTIKWSPGSEITYFNNGKTADPPASSMGVIPFSVTDETSIVFEEPGWHKFTLTVSDDDGGAVTRKVKVYVIQNAPCAQGLGYWKHQLSRYNCRYNRNIIHAARLKTYTVIINAYSSVFSEEVSLKSLDHAYDILRFENSDLRAKANAHLLVAWFNFAQASIKWNDSIDWNGDGVTDGTFFELIKQAENILLDSKATQAEIELAKDIAEGITQYGQDVCPAH